MSTESHCSECLYVSVCVRRHFTDVLTQKETGSHLFELSPSVTGFEYYAMSFGARSQSAKTYLERHYESFATASDNDLIGHGLLALCDTLQQDNELNIHNTSLSIVGKNRDVQIIEDEALQEYLHLLGPETSRTAHGRDGDGDETHPGGIGPIETDDA